MESALLVNISFSDRDYRDSWPITESAKELEQLVRSSGVRVLEGVLLKRDRPVSGTLIGKGQALGLGERCRTLHADLVVCGEELSPSQHGNLEDLVGAKVIDRTQLILDIFAQRAHSQEGKVQVELAQLEYLFPRLSGKGILLSRLGGGIGTRGPGEQKLEMDRRRIRLRIGRLNREIIEIRRRRDEMRRKREENVPTAALIGYTNVGKTTLLNALTDAGARVQDQLFTTLDPLSRRLTLPNRQVVLLSDTVGFLHRLPHHLIEAFEATLEEARGSTLFLHVVDASHPRMSDQVTAVEEVLALLGAQEKQKILVLNKTDRVDHETLRALLRRFPEAVAISAVKKEGFSSLLERLQSILSAFTRHVTIFLKHADQGWLKAIYAEASVLDRHLSEEGLLLQARVPERLYGRLLKAELIRFSH